MASDSTSRVESARHRMRRETHELRAIFERLETARRWRHREIQGPDVDIAAVVDRYGALRAGSSSHTRLYLSRRRHSRNTAIAILLDASVSTDAWVDNRRVIDVEKEATIALGDALDGVFDDVLVAGFMSQTRHDCRLLIAKGFRDAWREGVQRVASLEPQGYTRIGPALRHTIRMLKETGARKKLLLLVSDGKPTDVDRYEGEYGLADIRRAVVDADIDGVVAHAIGVDPAAKAWLPRMFGHGRASIVARPGELVRSMATIASMAMQ